MSKEPYEMIADNKDTRIVSAGLKLSEIADAVCSEYLRFGGVPPSMYKQLQLAVDEFLEEYET